MPEIEESHQRILSLLDEHPPREAVSLYVMSIGSWKETAEDMATILDMTREGHIELNGNEDERSMTLLRDDLDDSLKKARVIQLAAIRVADIVGDPDVAALPTEIGRLIQQLEDLKNQLKKIDHTNEDI